MPTHPFRLQPRRALRFALTVAVGLVVGCGGVQKVEAPRTARVPAAVAELPVLLGPGTPERVRRFDVNPTVATVARPGLVIAPTVDRAPWRDADAALRNAALPADPRPAAFVAAVAPTGPGDAPLGTGVAPSVVRAGYEVLLVTIHPPSSPMAPRPVPVVLEARSGLLDAGQIDALGSIEGPTAGLVLAAERPRWLASPEVAPPVWPERIRQAGMVGPAAIPAALAMSARADIAASRAVLIARDATALHAVEVRPGPDLAARVSAAITMVAGHSAWLSDALVEVQFDPRQVERYRLIGLDGRGGPGGRGTVLWHGRPEALLFEIRRTPDAPEGRALGTVSLRGTRGDGARFTVRQSLRALPSPDAALASVAAATAERLRQSWWARPLSWSRVRAAFEALPAEVRARPAGKTLGGMIDRAAELDRRPPRFDGPLSAMGLHHVPGGGP